MHLNITPKALILAVVALFTVCCNNDNLPDTEGKPSEEPSNTITATLHPQTRTSLGNEIGDIYPVYWSKNDKIGVNAIPSEEIVINENNPSIATFILSETPEFPRNITYPYCTSSSIEQAIVVFPTEQQYTEGSFSEGSAPMYGYAEQGNEVPLKHLATIFQFPIKAKVEGVTLSQVVVTADTAIAGEFTVDCKSGEITPTDTATKSITYTLPTDFSLSVSAEKIFHISLPATNISHCKVEFVEASGKKMTATWQPKGPISAGIVREFEVITYNENSAITLQPLTVEEEEMLIYYKKIYGNVRYSDGTPIAGVAMSDGFQVVTTDKNGYYELDGVTPESWYIYCSLPADVEIPIDEFGRPAFFKKYPSNLPRYDFTFNKLPNGKEKKFSIFAIADTQPTGEHHLDHFRTQATPEINAHSKSLGMPCYGIVLGDLVGSVPTLMDDMRSELAYDKMGMPIFTVMGNHDHISYSDTDPVFPDERNNHWMLKIQRDFEECFGPVNYSFNRGDVHIVGMRNVRHKDNVKASNYETAFTKEQFEWLKADLALVPKEKMVVICFHIPIINGGRVGDGTYRQEMLNLLDQFAESHILSGHTHYMRPYDYVWNNTGHKMYEHCIASTRYDMRGCNIHRDGTPCGYAVLKVENSAMVDWYYKGFPEGMNSRDDQMRLYRGATIIGAEPSGTNKYGTMGYYQLPFDNNTLLANIFTSDPSWKVEVYEDGVYSGKMSYIYNMDNSLYEQLVGDGSLTNPRRVADGVACSRDFWAIGILFGYLGSEVNNNYNTCRTMWRYTLKNPNAQHIEVRATDRFGYIYTEETITDNSNSDSAFY